jgi:hypothetical protein
LRKNATDDRGVDSGWSKSSRPQPSLQVLNVLDAQAGCQRDEPPMHRSGPKRQPLIVAVRYWSDRRIILREVRVQSRPDEWLSVRNMVAGEPMCGIAIMRLDRVDNGIVLEQRPRNGLAKCVQTNPQQAIVFLDKRGFHSGHPGITAQLCHGDVKRPVKIEECGIVVHRFGRLTELVQLMYCLVIGLGRLGRAGGRNNKTQAKELINVTNRNRIDPIALAWENGYKPFLFETKQGVSNRRTAYAVSLRKGLFSQFLARLKLTG